jgi:hypothetical protein
LTLFYNRGLLHLCNKTLVTYQVTNDHGPGCRHELNTSIVQTIHNPNCTTLAHRLQPQHLGWTKTRLY